MANTLEFENKVLEQALYNTAQKFHRPDGTIQPVHCGWISIIPDNWGENKLLLEDK